MLHKALSLDGEWVTGTPVKKEDKFYILTDVIEHIKRNDYVVSMIEIEPTTLCTSTNILDVDGNHIFLGDIVKKYELYISNEDGDEFARLKLKYLRVGYSLGDVMLMNENQGDFYPLSLETQGADFGYSDEYTEDSYSERDFDEDFNWEVINGLNINSLESENVKDYIGPIMDHYDFKTKEEFFQHIGIKVCGTIIDELPEN